MLARIQRARLAADHARIVERAFGDSVGSDRPGGEPPSNGGDEERLRGIPAIGRGVSGEIRGTRPDSAVR